MTELVRADALRNYPELVAQLGGDAEALLRKAKIPPEALREEDAFIDFRAMLTLMEDTATALRCKDFGLRLGLAHEDIAIFGPVALAAQNCETFGEAIDCMSRYFHTHNPSVLISLEPRDSLVVRLCVKLALPDPPARWQYNERNAVLAYIGLARLSSNASRPLKISLPHAPLSPPARYYGIFNSCPVQFDNECVAIDFKATDLRIPMRGHNAQLRKVATAFLENQQENPRSTLRMRVRDAIRPLLPSGRCDQTNLADALYMHPRTMQRRLAVEGTSFEAIKDEVRRELAQRYLLSTLMPLSQVTALLGYSEQSALTRSCQRWFRSTPLALRRNRRDTEKKISPTA